MYLQKTMEMENQGIQSQFLTRLTSLPMVHTAWDHATSTYSKVKQSNSLLDYTMSTVEKSVIFANEKAKPLVKKFETQISSADLLASKGLQKLENTVPIIKETPEKILQDTKALYNNVVKTGLDRYHNLQAYGSNKVNAVKEYGTRRATVLLSTEYGKILTSTVDGALTLTETCVNFYLPPVEGEEEKLEKDKPVLQRMSYLSSVVHRRARKLASQKLLDLQTRTASVVPAIDLTGHIATVKSYPNHLYTNATWLWSELNRVPEPLPEGQSATLQQQAWTTARQLTHGLVNTYTSTLTSVQRIPEHIHSSVNSAYVYSIEIYTSVQKIPARELPQQLVTQARSILKVDERVATVVATLEHLPAFQWLVHVYYRTQTSAPSSGSTDQD